MSGLCQGNFYVQCIVTACSPRKISISVRFDGNNYLTIDNEVEFCMHKLYGSGSNACFLKIADMATVRNFFESDKF